MPTPSRYEMRTPSRLIASLVPAACAAALVPAAVAAPPPPMTVAVHAASGASSSYFTLSARPGALAQAGSLELRNGRKHSITVRLDPVGALTASTLGSAYRTEGSAATGQTRWIVLPRRRIVLAPLATATIPVAVRLPEGSRPGDYLSGISVEALGQQHETRAPGNVSIASVQRYAVGLFVKVPGPRMSLIRLTSARVDREPAGLTFYLNGRNDGNSILQNVRGHLLITRGSRVVGRTAIGPGTFVSGTSIAYPLLTPREVPREGAVYRVRAVMRYAAGKVARLDTRVRFGHAAAKVQEDFGGPHVDEPGKHGSLFTILIAVAGLLAALGCLLAVLFLVRRRRIPGQRVALRALDRALVTARAEDVPLSLLRVADLSAKPRPRAIVTMVRSRLRRGDRLYRLARWELLVIAPDTRVETLSAIGRELQRDVSRTTGSERVVITSTEAGLRGADELLKRLRDPRAEHLDEIEMTADSVVLR
jgi:hypothetical protein